MTHAPGDKPSADAQSSQQILDESRSPDGDGQRRADALDDGPDKRALPRAGGPDAPKGSAGVVTAPQGDGRLHGSASGEPAAGSEPADSHFPSADAQSEASAYYKQLGRHVAAIDGRRPQNGHSERGFSTCPHPECVAFHTPTSAQSEALDEDCRMADEGPKDRVERALWFVSQFNGDGRCALNCIHSEALAAAFIAQRAEVARLRAERVPPSADDRIQRISAWFARGEAMDMTMEQAIGVLLNHLSDLVAPQPAEAQTWQPIATHYQPHELCGKCGVVRPCQIHDVLAKLLPAPDADRKDRP